MRGWVKTMLHLLGLGSVRPPDGQLAPDERVKEEAEKAAARRRLEAIDLRLQVLGPKRHDGRHTK